MLETLKEVGPEGFFSLTDHHQILTYDSERRVKVFRQELQLKLSLYPPHKGLLNINLHE